MNWTTHLLNWWLAVLDNHPLPFSYQIWMRMSFLIFLRWKLKENTISSWFFVSIHHRSLFLVFFASPSKKCTERRSFPPFSSVHLLKSACITNRYETATIAERPLMKKSSVKTISTVHYSSSWTNCRLSKNFLLNVFHPPSSLCSPVKLRRFFFDISVIRSFVFYSRTVQQHDL